MTFSTVKEINVKNQTQLSSAALVAGSTEQQQAHSSSAQQQSLAQIYKISLSHQSKNSSMMESHLKEMKKSYSKTLPPGKGSKFKSARTSIQTIRSSKLTRKRTKSKGTKSSSLKKTRKLSLKMSIVKKWNDTKMVIPSDSRTLSGQRNIQKSVAKVMVAKVSDSAL